jgi:hypothetical protein
MVAPVTPHVLGRKTEKGQGSLPGLQFSGQLFFRSTKKAKNEFLASGFPVSIFFICSSAASGCSDDDSVKAYR